MNTGKRFLTNLIYKYGIYVIFFLLIITFTIAKSSFIKPGNISNLLKQSSAWSVAATGLVFVMLTGGMDISIGSVMYFTAYMCIDLMSRNIIPDTILGMFILIITSLIIGGCLGSINGAIISKMGIPPLIVTISTISLFRGIAYTINHVKNATFNNSVGDYLGRAKIGGFLPVVTLIMIITMVIGQYVLKYTKFGRQIYAIGDNEYASRQIGIPVDRIKFLVYLICGATAGLSGLLIAAQTNVVTTNFANEHHFIIISCAVLGGVSLFGGKGNIFPGAFIGILMTVAIENGLVFLGADPYFYTIVRGVIIFIAVMMDCIDNKNELR